jgi:phospholipase D1/2
LRTAAAATSAPSGGKRRRPAWGKLAAGVLVLAALAAAWRFTPLADYLTLERLGDWARVVRETPWAPIALVLAYTPAALILFPRPLLTLLAVVAFGPWVGLGYAVVGVMIAALVTYTIGRAMPRSTLRRIGGDTAEALAKGARRHGVLAVLAFNLMPVPPFAVQNMMAGAARINVWEYALGTLLSLTPAFVAAAVFGTQLTAMMSEDSTVSWWAIGAAAAGMAVFVYFGRRWARKYA